MKVYLIKDKLTNEYYEINGKALILAVSRKQAKKKVSKQYNVKEKQLEVFYMTTL